jgi:hypothetical protein
MTEDKAVLDSEDAVPVGDVSGEDRIAVVAVDSTSEAEFVVTLGPGHRHPASLPVIARPPLHPSAAILVPAGCQLTGRLVTTPSPGRHSVVTYQLGVLV